MDDLVYADESYEIIGACFEVYNRIGSGFCESIYQECLEIEFKYQEIPAKSQEKIPVFYRQKKLDKHFRSDFHCYEKIVLEIKAINELVEDNISQVLNYLKATDMKLGLLANFGHSEDLQYKRILL